VEMLPRRIIFRSVDLFVQVFEMKNCCGNTLKIRLGPSSIAFKVKILFGSTTIGRKTIGRTTVGRSQLGATTIGREDNWSYAELVEKS
jgi:hypothetical protein